MLLCYPAASSTVPGRGAASSALPPPSGRTAPPGGSGRLGGGEGCHIGLVVVWNLDGGSGVGVG